MNAKLNKKALTKVQGIIIALVIIVAGIVGTYYVVYLPHETSTKLATFVFATIQEPTTLDPAVVYDGSDRITTQIYEGLTRFKDGTFEVEPCLATSWTISPDFKIYTFYLRKGVKFHCGAELNATVVKESYTRMLKIGKGMSWAFKMVLDPEGIEVVDDYTVRFTLKKSYPPFLSMTASRYAAGIICLEWKEHEKNGDFAQEWASTNTCGTGPYMLKEWVRKQQVVTVKNPNYWGGWEGKHFDTVIMKIVPEPSTQRIMLERGEIDAATHIGIDDLEALKSNPEIQVLGAQPGLSTFNFFILMNTRKGILTNAKVREALSWAFSYEACATYAFKGHATTAVGPLPRGMPCHNEEIFVYYKDAQKARQLLEEAGYPNGGFTLTITYMAGQDWAMRILNVLTSDLAEIGITLIPKPLTWSAMMNNLVNQETAPDLCIADYWPDYPDSIEFLAGICDYYFWGGREEKDYLYYNQTLADLFTSALFEANDTLRCQLCKQAQNILVEDKPAIWVLDLLYRTAMRSNVRGYTYNAMLEMTYNVYGMWKE
jgi:peptide/nickel transport system substrate-binding protein